MRKVALLSVLSIALLSACADAAGGYDTIASALANTVTPNSSTAPAYVHGGGSSPAAACDAGPVGEFTPSYYNAVQVWDSDRTKVDASTNKHAAEEYTYEGLSGASAATVTWVGRSTQGVELFVFDASAGSWTSLGSIPSAAGEAVSETSFDATTSPSLDAVTDADGNIRLCVATSAPTRRGQVARIESNLHELSYE